MFLSFVSNIYLYIGLYTDKSIYTPPSYNKIKNCHNNIIKRKTILSFRYMFFFFLQSCSYDILSICFKNVVWTWIFLKYLPWFLDILYFLQRISDIRDPIIDLFSILFTYFQFAEGLSVFSPCFLRYIQNNLEYLIQNMIHQIIQILHSMLELVF